MRSRWRSRASTCADQKRRNCASHASISLSGSGFRRYRRRCASTVDATNPASRSTFKCFDTVGCDIRSCRSISPTDCSDETSRLKIARRLGSAMISNTDSMLSIYVRTYMPVKVYLALRYFPGSEPDSTSEQPDPPPSANSAFSFLGSTPATGSPAVAHRPSAGVSFLTYPTTASQFLFRFGAPHDQPHPSSHCHDPALCLALHCSRQSPRATGRQKSSSRHPSQRTYAHGQLFLAAR